MPLLSRTMNTIKLAAEPLLTLEVCLKTQHITINLFLGMPMKLVFQEKLIYLIFHRKYKNT